MKRIIIIRKDGLTTQYDTDQDIEEVLLDIAVRYRDTILSITIIKR